MRRWRKSLEGRAGGPVGHPPPLSN
jgi:hypothetical protein